LGCKGLGFPTREHYDSAKQCQHAETRRAAANTKDRKADNWIAARWDRGNRTDATLSDCPICPARNVTGDTRLFCGWMLTLPCRAAMIVLPDFGEYSTSTLFLPAD
jgi:hypothetical protein